jgi:hypothetical protein
LSNKRPEVNGFIPDALKDVNGLLPQDADAAERWFNIVQCLLPIWHEGRIVRKQGSLRLRPNGSYWHLTLSCPGEGKECSIEVSSLLEAFDALETVLREGKANWRPDWDSQKKVAKVKDTAV